MAANVLDVTWPSRFMLSETSITPILHTRYLGAWSYKEMNRGIRKEMVRIVSGLVAIFTLLTGIPPWWVCISKLSFSSTLKPCSRIQFDFWVDFYRPCRCALFVVLLRLVFKALVRMNSIYCLLTRPLEIDVIILLKLMTRLRIDRADQWWWGQYSNRRRTIRRPSVDQTLDTSSDGVIIIPCHRINGFPGEPSCPFIVFIVFMWLGNRHIAETSIYEA